MSATAGGVLLRLRCRGHPGVRATHGKTMEFALTADITARATCVVAVAAQFPGAGERPPAPLAGPVRLRLSGGGEAVVRAVANPLWQPGRGIVIRRSGNRYPDTFATDADVSAAGLPRDLIAWLRDPSRELQVTVERDPPPSTRGVLVLLALWDRQVTARLLAEAEAADVIIAEDAAAQASLRAAGIARFWPARSTAAGPGAEAGARRGQRRGTGPGPAGAQPARPGTQPSQAPLPAAEDVLARGGRVLVAAAEALPGRTALPLLSDPGLTAVEVAGLPPALAAAAASPSRAPVLLGDGGAPREARALARSAPAATRLVVRVHAADVPALCRAAPAARPVAAVTVVPEAPHQRERVLRIPPDQAGEALPSRTVVACCLDAGPAPAGPGGAGSPFAGPGADQVAELARALAQEGISARTLASALAQLPGWSRNRAYEFARDAAGEAGGTP